VEKSLEPLAKNFRINATREMLKEASKIMWRSSKRMTGNPYSVIPVWENKVKGSVL